MSESCRGAGISARSAGPAGTDLEGSIPGTDRALDGSGSSSTGPSRTSMLLQAVHQTRAPDLRRHRSFRPTTSPAISIAPFPFPSTWFGIRRPDGSPRRCWAWWRAPGGVRPPVDGLLAPCFHPPAGRRLALWRSSGVFASCPKWRLCVGAFPDPEVRCARWVAHSGELRPDPEQMIRFRRRRS